MKRFLAPCAFLVSALVVQPLSAQLVADGTTEVVSGTSVHIAGDLVVGTNGSFTTLIITNSGTVTNTGTAEIGYGPFAMTNQVIVTGSNSIWQSEGNLAIGSFGTFNELTLTNGGRMFGTFGNLGHLPGSGFNVVRVVGEGSRWELSELLNVGNSGPSNRLVIANGGTVINPFARLGFGPESIGNTAVVADPGSRWVSTTGLAIGEDTDFNHLLVTNGAAVLSAGAYIGGKFTQSGSGASNSVILTGAGSTWTNTGSSSVGNFGAFNQLTVSDGAVMRNTAEFAHLVLGWQPSGSNNTLAITGTNSLFSNRDATARLTIGQSSAFNQLLITDGGRAETDFGELAQNAASSNNVASISGPGSHWFSTFDLYVGNAGSGNQLTVSDGGLVSAAQVFVGFEDTSSNNIATVNGGSVIASNATQTSVIDVRRGSLVLNSGVARADFVFSTNGSESQLIFNGGLLQSGSTIHDQGTPFLVGDDGSPATLELFGNGTHLFVGGLHLTTNSLLAGNGTVMADINAAGGSTLSPGTSIGTLMVTGSLMLSGGSTSRFDLDSALSTSTNDHIGGLASVTYDGTLQLVYPPDTLAGSDAFHLFAATNYAGAFNEVSPSIPGPEQEWDLTELAVNGILRVSSKPYITSEPQDLTVFVGADAPFTVVARGSTSMSYQWRFNETDIAGATGSTYTRTNAQFEDAGGYTVVITNYLGSITSQIATLTVESPIARDVVISQIYGGGGGSGATYQNDFIELFNPTTNTIDLSTWSVQHTGAGGTTWTAANLSGSIAPHGYYLVQLGSSGANGVALPPADAVSTINANAANGKVVLMIGNLPLSGSNPIGMPGVVDFVGYGTANAFEGSGPAAAPLIGNNTTSILRKDGGYLDANDNANDFTTLSPPTPRNSSAPPNLPSTPVISATLSSARYTTNHFEFLVAGTPGSNYVVQATTNLLLSPWLSIHTNVSPFTFLDTNASGFPLRFYRAVHVSD